MVHTRCNPSPRPKPGGIWTWLPWIVMVIAVGAPVVAYLGFKHFTYDAAELEMQPFNYPLPLPNSCGATLHAGAAGFSIERSAVVRVAYHVKTPSNYRPTYAHPLLLVYAPSGVSASLNEKFTGLTATATRQGFIVVYAGSRKMSIEGIRALGTIAHEVAEKWCVDTKRVFLTGHSDGGTISHALAFLVQSSLRPTAIAPSAAGINQAGFAAEACPEPTSVMMMHNKGDGHFPGFGAEAAAWWAACNQCDAEPVEQAYAGCVEYKNCRSGVKTLYCEGGGGHLRWPKMHQEIVDFFNAQPARLGSALRSRQVPASPAP